MAKGRFAAGLEMEIDYPGFRVRVALLSATRLRFEILEGPFARTGTVEIQRAPLGDGLFALSWQERDGTTVVHLQDDERQRVHTFATPPDGRFLRMRGTLTVLRSGDADIDGRPGRTGAPVLEAMPSPFQRRDASAMARPAGPDCVARAGGGAVGAGGRRAR